MQTSPIRIVIVDDHSALRETLSDLLRETPGIEVVGQAGDAGHGTDVVRRLHPDVVLMDVSMPGVSGIIATGWIRSDAPDVKVIGLSVFDDRESAEQMRQAGAVAQVSKSVPFQELVATIRSVAGRH